MPPSLGQLLIDGGDLSVSPFSAGPVELH